ncbi:MAG: 1,4-alpha-glucan branching protein GlgB [Prosthecobacter sp.]|nr:1,4-alpha-glucan branching protein GlgB [Prosthecobacter sp.]
MIEDFALQGELSKHRELDGGSEHQVFFDSSSGRVLKLTRPPTFGARGDAATYLLNLLAINRQFCDDILLEGIIQNQAGVSILTSQPFILGDCATDEQIRHFLATAGFVPDEQPYSYKHPQTGILVADARGANVLADADGGIYPIDLHLLWPGHDLAELAFGQNLDASPSPMGGVENLAYDLEIKTLDGLTYRQADPYSFGTLLGEQDLYFFKEGTHQKLWDCLGAHLKTLGGVEGVQFAVWAPNARRVSVVGDFNHWDGRVHPMRNREGVWEIFIPGLQELAHYKFEVLGAEGGLHLKSDPFAFFGQHGTQTASLVFNLDRYGWGDQEWMRQRAATDLYHAPMSIYEVHLGSWKRIPEQKNRPKSYRELADDLIPYVKSMNFTHIELMPVAEHPFDGSWGYQITGYFAPTSRFGNPDEFREFVDRCHQAGIGVLLDWVPGHFPKDAFGLARFDGTCLYEHADPRQGEHQDWGTLIFNYGRAEVKNFLIANALYWLEEFHIDGLRVDAVASMLYLDYSRKPWAWVPNKYGGRENLEAIDFMRELNRLAYEKHPGCTIIAEESTAWPGVSKPTDTGGLGFGFKWNMGWMNDTLRYMEEDPVHRKYHHGEATFSMLYAYDENFILVLSHDEVVHGKGSLINKMPGDRWQKFANLRMLYGWMWAHPGKKLLFMGGEFGQWQEWSHERSLDWHLFLGEEHAAMQKLVRDLNWLYITRPAMHALDHEGGGFQWLDASNADHSIFAFMRRSPCGDVVCCVVNATPVPRKGYRVGVPEPGSYRELVNTDAPGYAGSGMTNPLAMPAGPTPWQDQPWSILIDLPPLGTVWLGK